MMFPLMSSMVVSLVLQLALISPLIHGFTNHLMVTPQSPVVQIGTNVTATCVILNTTEVTADDLYWKINSSIIPKEYYTKINASAVSVTLHITDEVGAWLFCAARSTSHYINPSKDRFLHGIFIKKGYHPEKPENLSCKAMQEGRWISGNLTCRWDSASRQTESVPTSYTLFVEEHPGPIFNVTTQDTKITVRMDVFPHHTSLVVRVVAHNSLGKAESEHLEKEAKEFVKTFPPSNVKVFAEEMFPTSLLIEWEHPIERVYLKLAYQIRFCPHGSHVWRHVSVPEEYTEKDITSFRLQNLRPFQQYDVQVRCKSRRGGYWSDWSANVTQTTPEDSPASKPDLWMLYAGGGEVQLVCKDPEMSNGRITAFNVTIQRSGNDSSEQEVVPVQQSGATWMSRQGITPLRRVSLANQKFIKACATASNSVGTSPKACLHVPSSPSGRHRVEGMKVWSQDGQMFVEWKRPNSSAVSEYVIQWSDRTHTDWQRENGRTNKTAIKGKLQSFVCYNITVYPIRAGWLLKPTSLEAYLEQGAPLEGPSVTRTVPGYDHAVLEWSTVPLERRQGFITNCTVFYRRNDKPPGTYADPPKAMAVPANATSITLTQLSGNTKYEVWVGMSTIAGMRNGTPHTFNTLKHAPGMVEGIVVGVSLCFLFLVLMVIILCIYKKDVIKENFWPQIPNPGESTIGNWSPGYPLQAETPKENCVTGVSVLDVGVCEVKLGFEDDKTSLSLKKDKYLSEEHSSGIGGSSCMSSPRQSVSDSDEGPDLADSTASTVQYSSVVASSGYKGQTPGSQSQHSIFSRSESTQPLLDSEEHPDVLLQRSPRETVFPPNPDDFRPLGGEQQPFCPLKEDAEQTPESDSLQDDTGAPLSSYMPQLAGYRPQ
ncbi:PREDICTED: interleukin-6 receptor subunit beta isoform X1 [Cyprinodon variegatus]|uniref:interleukin-6 receptor subunit beta isoform X1 n=1 Tax=Cyprinodon variegatus TaxID=28743 RepID=UPI0007429E3C|nr:PREDICTED: interleukin-6 receptor subunit beta isoform X1 [Cyprinodon variegatus]